MDVGERDLNAARAVGSLSSQQGGDLLDGSCDPCTLVHIPALHNTVLVRNELG